MFCLKMKAKKCRVTHRPDPGRSATEHFGLKMHPILGTIMKITPYFRDICSKHTLLKGILASKIDPTERHTPV